MKSRGCPEETIKIGVKYCGSCNPLFVTGELFSRIKAELQETAPPGLEFSFVPPDTPGLKTLLVICGCPQDCASRPAGDFEQVVVVAGETVNRDYCSINEIPRRAAALLFSGYPCSQYGKLS